MLKVTADYLSQVDGRTHDEAITAALDCIEQIETAHIGLVRALAGIADLLADDGETHWQTANDDMLASQFDPHQVIQDAMAAILSGRKEIAYLRAGIADVPPQFLPTRVRLEREVRPDLSLSNVIALPGDYDCRANRLGAVSVILAGGDKLGVKPGEFTVLEWGENPHWRGKEQR